MPVIEYSGMKINLDDYGYLANYEDWNETVACALAEQEGIEELTKDKMGILKFMRILQGTQVLSHPALCLQERRPAEGLCDRQVYRPITA
jgi:sulfur relay (sulfurtransferase) DsrC/TusE family protein